jgi:hypothetical protein
MMACWTRPEALKRTLAGDALIEIEISAQNTIALTEEEGLLTAGKIASLP